MDTTIADFARFAAGFMRGEGLKPASRAEMLRGQLADPHREPVPEPRAGSAAGQAMKGLAAGLGVVTFDGPQGRGFFKGGHNDSTGNMWVCLEQRPPLRRPPRQRRRGAKVFPELVEAMLGPTGLPWRWEYGEPAAR